MTALPDLSQSVFSHEEIVALLSVVDPQDVEAVRAAAEKVLLKECGNGVYLRGLIEASNVCRCDCHYCGIRKSNTKVRHYTLAQNDILLLAQQAANLGYGSIVIQTGERQNKTFLDALEKTIQLIKTETVSDALPQGIGITLCIGEQTEETYRRLFKAGAHRYLLRIETTNPVLFSRIHPADQHFETRVHCLQRLKKIGYQVGTGVMIGLPGQTIEDLANDILFFKEQDIDMIGMGPFIPHPDTPLGGVACPDEATRLHLGHMMIAATRLVLRDVNIAATTALQALDPAGRERAFRFGANVMMPLMTPGEAREDYNLYPGKPNLKETNNDYQVSFSAFLNEIGRTLGQNQWGDAPHASRGGGNSPPFSS
ncbi:MAG: [FeFe] hydrogenase H-cluster radical SAM maturase HydE [Alphaproteobacteria bacterium]|nr:[FeFe] hydrogenase H-cluster radical SAM maturase HydE [Alphaproteobacteria bacterium]